MQREGGGLKRAVFLATAALLAMLVLAPMAWTQDTTVIDGTTVFVEVPTTVIDGTTFSLVPPTGGAFAGGGGGGNFGTTVIDGIPAGSPAPPPSTGGPAMLLPVASLLLGSGILTYAILRRR